MSWSFNLSVSSRAKAFKIIRAVYGLSVSDVATMAGVTASTVSRYERGVFDSNALDTVYAELLSKPESSDCIFSMIRKEG